jgi:hypothetical protein
MTRFTERACLEGQEVTIQGVMRSVPISLFMLHEELARMARYGGIEDPTKTPHREPR